MPASGSRCRASASEPSPTAYGRRLTPHVSCRTRCGNGLYYKIIESLRSGCRLHDRRLLKPCAVEITELDGHTTMKRSAGLFILGICSMPVLAHTPVIDCKTSSGSVEKLICSDPALAALDQNMAKVYQEAVAKGTDSAWLKATQRGWIKGATNAGRAVICRLVLVRIISCVLLNCR